MTKEDFEIYIYKIEQELNDTEKKMKNIIKYIDLKSLKNDIISNKSNNQNNKDKNDENKIIKYKNKDNDENKKYYENFNDIKEKSEKTEDKINSSIETKNIFEKMNLFKKNSR